MSDIRAALERLVSAYGSCQGQYEEIWPQYLDGPMAAARAALADEPVGEGPTDQELVDLACAIVDHWNPAPEPGEVADLVEWLGIVSEQFRLAKFSYEAELTDRAATLLEQLSAPAPVPVAVSVGERLPGEGDLDVEGTCWVWNFTAYTWGLFRLDLTAHSHWLPARAIPMPTVGEGKA